MKFVFSVVVYLFIASALLISCFTAEEGATDAPAKWVPCPDRISLRNDSLQIIWAKKGSQWNIDTVAVLSPDGTPLLVSQALSGVHAYVFSQKEPATESKYTFKNTLGEPFPSASLEYVTKMAKQATSPILMQEEGTEQKVWMQDCTCVVKGDQFREVLRVRFNAKTPHGELESAWSFDPQYMSDVVVDQKLKVSQEGWYMLQTPELLRIDAHEIAWATIPGFFQGDTIQKHFVQSVAYAQGIPNRPIIARDKTIGTLISAFTLKNNATVAVIPEPGQARDPWEKERDTHATSRLGLSHMNRQGDLQPVAYYPLLHHETAKHAANKTVQFKSRYSIHRKGWFEAVKHTGRDIYRLTDFLAMKQPVMSLTDRVFALTNFLLDDKTSHWTTTQYKGKTIGAQQYMVYILGSANDAIKNSDIGAVWMTAYLQQNQELLNNRLPYIRNFKYAQQEDTPGFTEGAAAGQYFLTKKKDFVEEWGGHVEPIAITYYILSDYGNMALFEPNNAELKERIRKGADRLLAWQKADGSWEIGYEISTQKPVHRDLKDLRPTFYGLLIAHKILDDPKYLEGAIKGADWLLKNGVDPGHFVGVCGDVQFLMDYSVAQISQGLLELYEVTKDKRYLQGALKTAKIYAANIYTHPKATKEKKDVQGRNTEDWQVSQVGLNFEHCTLGTSSSYGPILLSSHAGYFVRLSKLTNDPYFMELARAAALGRDAFMNPETKALSYNWVMMQTGTGVYPHHGWWQIGWVMDYLVSEAIFRTNGRVSFPGGFMTPKVGPHRPYGFAPGVIFGDSVNLHLREGALEGLPPTLDYFGASSMDSKYQFLILLNNTAEMVEAKIDINIEKLAGQSGLQARTIHVLDNTGTMSEQTFKNAQRPNVKVQVPGFSLKIIKLKL